MHGFARHRDSTPIIFEDGSFEETNNKNSQCSVTSYCSTPLTPTALQTTRKMRKKWTSAFRVVQSMTRFKNMRHQIQKSDRSGLSSNESTPSRTAGDSEENEIDPVYLALKQASGRYGSNTSSNGGSRRSSATHGINNQLIFDSATPSPRNLSQISLQDSGYSGGEFHVSSRNRLIGSTPQLANTNNGNTSNNVAPPISGIQGIQLSNNPVRGTSRGRCPKLSEKMKSLSLDCADMPPPVQSQIRNTVAYHVKQSRLARGIATSGESLDLGRSMSPPRRLVTVNATANNHRKLPQTPFPVPPTPKFSSEEGTHVVIHEYMGNTPECSLYLGDRLNIVDNGDPDWLHGVKVNDRMENLISFPNTCVTRINPGEQPMKIVHNYHAIECKLRLYRDQVVFAQPDHSIVEGKILIRNEHGTMAYCPAQYLMLL